MKIKGFEIAMHNYFGVILRTRQDLRNRVQKMLENNGYFDITLEMSQLLYCLRSLGGTANQQELADKIGKNKSSITSLIENLRKREMIVRKTDPTDRRNNLISFTDKGEAFITEFYPEVYRTYDIDKMNISLDEIVKITEILEKLIIS